MSNNPYMHDAGSIPGADAASATATVPAPNMHDVDTVACVGAGTIGGGWAAYFLARGFRVKVWDISPDAGDKLSALINAAWPALTKLGLAENADKEVSQTKEPYSQPEREHHHEPQGHRHLRTHRRRRHHRKKRVRPGQPG